MNEVFGDIIFCADSILRIKRNQEGKTINYPLIDIQNILEENDDFILQFLTRPTFIEKGTTLANIIISLHPWQRILSKLLLVNIDSYKKACFSLQEVENIFDEIVIYKETIIHKKRGKNTFNQLIDINAGGKIKNEENILCITDISFNQIKNVQISVQHENLMVFHNGNNNKNLFARKAKGVFESYRGRESIIIEELLTFGEIMEAIFTNGLNYTAPFSEEDSKLFSKSLNLVSEAIEKFDQPLEKKESEAEKVVNIFSQTKNIIPTEEFVYFENNDEDDEWLRDDEKLFHLDSLTEKMHKKLLSYSAVKIGEIDKT